jgi:rRNA-processing protein CGR1
MKTPFRPTAGQTSYAERLRERKNMAALKEKEKEMRQEKVAERQVDSLEIVLPVSPSDI